MMMVLRMRISLLVVIVLLLGLSVALAATNPTKQEYRQFLEGELGRALDKADHAHPRDSEVVRSFLRSQGPKLVESIVSNNTFRSNYGLCSHFETRLLGARISVLGIGRKFILLTERDELVRAFGRTGLAPSPAP